MHVTIESATLYGFANGLRDFLSRHGSKLDDSGRKELCKVIDSISQNSSVAVQASRFDNEAKEPPPEKSVPVNRDTVLDLLRLLTNRITPDDATKHHTAQELREALGGGPNPLTTNQFRAAVCASVRAHANESGSDLVYDIIAGELPVLRYIRANLEAIYAAECLEKELGGI